MLSPDRFGGRKSPLPADLVVVCSRSSPRACLARPRDTAGNILPLSEVTALGSLGTSSKTGFVLEPVEVLMPSALVHNFP